MKKTTKLALMALGAPTLSGCMYCGYLDCPQPPAIAWDGRNGDGSPWDGGLVGGCYDLCLDAGVGGSHCDAISSSELQCRRLCRGRAPPGLVSLSPLGSTLGSALAASAEFELAAVHAFWQLGDELDAHGLYGEGARSAAFDEVRHARDTTKLALSLGVMPALPRVAPLREPRSLEAIAIDNAFEGCGRELFGATLNAWQAEHASDQRVRTLMRDITPDEQEHAAFSMELSEALMPRLPVAARRKVREAQERAFATLGPEAVPENVRRQLGLMDADQARHAARRLLDTARV